MVSTHSLRVLKRMEICLIQWEPAYRGGDSGERLLNLCAGVTEHCHVGPVCPSSETILVRKCTNPVVVDRLVGIELREKEI